MKLSQISKIIAVIIAIVLIMAGFVGLALPVIPGILLLIAGIILFNKHIRFKLFIEFEKRLKQKLHKGIQTYRKYRVQQKKKKLKKIEKKIVKLERKIRRK